MEFKKIVNLLATTSYDTDLLRIATKKWIEVDVNQEEITMLTKKLELKHQF